MQKRFAEFIVFGGPNGPMTQAEAAIAAGYSPNNARVEGSSLLNPRLSPLVVQYVGNLKEERLERSDINAPQGTEFHFVLTLKGFWAGNRRHILLRRLV